MSFIIDKYKYIINSINNREDLDKILEILDRRVLINLRVFNFQNLV